MPKLEKSGNAKLNENVNEVTSQVNVKEDKVNRYLKASKGNMYDFITHTFNPIIGICQHECGYCYVPKMCNKLKPVRLEANALKGSLEKDNFIFVGSGTDVFAQNVPSEWITEVLDYCDKFDNKYLFQSKNPMRFMEFITHPVFKKSVICTTIESNRHYAGSKAPTIEERVSAIEIIKSEYPTIEIYITIEPIMDFDLSELTDLIKRCTPVQVNIGADSKRSKLPEPTRNQILNLIDRLSQFTTVEEKKNLKRLTKIEDPMKNELVQAKKQKATSNMMKVQIMVKTEKGYTIKEENRKFGLVKENRPIKDSDVNGFLQIIQNGKYDETQSIVTVEASELVEKYNIVNLEGNVITEKNAHEYLIVLDGQHRTTAFSKLNSIREEGQIVIPNVHIKQGLENIREYLADINTVGHSWNMADKVCVAAISTENKILNKINELIKEGYNASAAMMMCAGRKINDKEIKNILSTGDTSDLSNEDQAIERADRFVITGMAISEMTIKMLAKRYFIRGFNLFSKSNNSDDIAFTALQRLTIEDFKATKDEEEFVEKLAQAIA